MASIEKYTLKSGSIRFRVRYLKPDNKSTDKGGFRTKTAAREWLHEMEVAKQAGMFVTAKATTTPMRGLIEEYVALTVGLSRNTIAQRRSHAKNWVLPKWSSWAVGHVSKSAVETWLEEMAKAGAGVETIRKAHQLLVSIMERAVDASLISRNPVKKIRLPRTTTRRHPYLTYDEVAELANVIDPRYRLLVSFLALTGLRFGEAAALSVHSIDLTTRLIHVDQAVTEVHGVLEFGPTKSHERRTVAYPAILDSELQRHLATKKHDALLFTSPEGFPLRLVSWRRRYWNPTIQKLNEHRKATADERGYRPFPKVTPHDLRHTAASLAVRGGASVVGVQRMLGHADAKMTLNTYVDLFTSDLTAVASEMRAVAVSPTNALLSTSRVLRSRTSPCVA